MLLKLWQSDGSLYKKKTQVEVLSSRRFVQKIGEVTFFFVGGATQARGDLAGEAQDSGWTQTRFFT